MERSSTIGLPAPVACKNPALLLSAGIPGKASAPAPSATSFKNRRLPLLLPFFPALDMCNRYPTVEFIFQ
jgi:hypothetical protein